MPGIDEVQVTVTTTSYECELLREGYRRIAGVDEAGRGALAGPVVAAAVILPLDNPIEQLTDSKLLTAKQRQELCRQIQDCAIAWAVGVVDNGTIDAHNILIATHMAMRLAVEKLSPPADFVLIDGLPVEGIAVAHRSVVGGDRCCYSIAAASIIAKVTRDEIMRHLARQYPGYGFEQHKGYATSAHRQALSARGPCPVHRRSFRPVAVATQARLDLEQQVQ